MKWLKRVLQSWLDIRPYTVNTTFCLSPTRTLDETLEKTYFSEETKALFRKSAETSEQIKRMVAAEAGRNAQR